MVLVMDKLTVLPGALRYRRGERIATELGIPADALAFLPEPNGAAA